MTTSQLKRPAKTASHLLSRLARFLLSLSRSFEDRNPRSWWDGPPGTLPDMYPEELFEKNQHFILNFR